MVDIFEAFTPTASILGSLSLRALTDQSPSDDAIVAAAKEQSKAAAGKVAVAAAVRAALYPTATSAFEPIIDFSMSSATVDDKLAVLKYKYLCSYTTGINKQSQFFLQYQNQLGSRQQAACGCLGFYPCIHPHVF